MEILPNTGTCLPTDSHRLLLQACLAPAEEAVQAWQRWQQTHSLDTVEEGTFRMLPLIHHNLNAAGYKGTEMPLLKGISQRNWYVNQRLFNRLEQTLAALEAQGIPTLLLKGTALSTAYYPHTALRAMQDVDVMVPPEYAKEVIALLARTGWQPAAPLKRNFINASHANMFVNASRDELDLHWHLMPECCGSKDDEGFWQRSVPLTFRSVATRTLSPADHLLHACIHGYQWNWAPTLRWVADAAMILRHAPAIAWEDMSAFAVKHRLTLRLNKALTYLKDEIGLDISPMLIERLRQQPVSEFEYREHQLVTRAGYEGKDMRREIVWPLKRVWYTDMRLSPEKSAWRRLLSMPGILIRELRLPHIFMLPVALLQRVYIKGRLVWQNL